ncbi:YdiU family protein [Pseudomonas sp. F1_0610]|uniref:protein adenylyltransferase SelO n=1 Tax=Pseudomonas sp. F1_0610 TaxID=3114284 RepID=UPI0039C189CD
MLLDQLLVTPRFATLGGAFFAQVQPTALDKVELLALSPSGLQLLGITNNTASQEQLRQLCAGTWQWESYPPLAMVYAGHQFGGYSPRLGDGRGLLVAEVQTPDQTIIELHLKGAGLTPFSRMGDGRAVLRSSIREFLVSEYMQAIGVPTTQVLALARSSTKVWREQVETAASLLRLAPSHIRFGHFEYFYYSRQFDEHAALTEYVLKHHYPECLHKPQPALAFLEQVIERTAILIAYWQAFGFCHGVMNTDNMSILGLTFDYGPFAFLDDYQANYICNKSDSTGRYAFNQQPEIGLWNLTALAETFTQQIAIEELKTALASYWNIFQQSYQSLMCQRLGMHNDAQAAAIISDLLKQMQQNQIDYNNLFRRLSEEPLALALEGLADDFVDGSAFSRWAAAYTQQVTKLDLDETTRLLAMQAFNPRYSLRNYYLQQVIEAAEKGDNTVFSELHAVCQSPFLSKEEWFKWCMPPPDTEKAQPLSCSS